MSKYELMYIIDTSLEEASRKELVERISNLIVENGGTVEKVDEWASALPTPSTTRTRAITCW